MGLVPATIEYFLLGHYLGLSGIALERIRPDLATICTYNHNRKLFDEQNSENIIPVQI